MSLKKDIFNKQFSIVLLIIHFLDYKQFYIASNSFAKLTGFSTNSSAPTSTHFSCTYASQ